MPAIKTGVDIIRSVYSPDFEWFVLYNGNRKIWEGNDCNPESFRSIAESLDAKFYEYEFTDASEIDGCTPDSFINIKGITEI